MREKDREGREREKKKGEKERQREREKTTNALICLFSPQRPVSAKDKVRSQELSSGLPWRCQEFNYFSYPC